MQYGLGLGLSVWNSNYLYPSMSLNFLSGSLDPKVTFTRASTATYFGSDGLLKVAAANVPRFDYNPVTLQPKGLLIEGARTNSIAASRDYNNVFWGKSLPESLTITSDSDMAMDGTMSADRFDTVSANCGVNRIGLHTGLVIGDAVTATVAIKPISAYCKVKIGYSGTAFTAAKQGAFDLISGTHSVVGDANIRSMRLLFNGYWLLTLTATATADGNANVIIQSVDATPQSFIVDHSQSEIGRFASSIIPTTTTSVTRTSDKAVMTGANFSDWFHAATGTFVAEFDGVANTSGSLRRAMEVSDGTITNQIVIGYSELTTTRVRITTGGVTQADVGGVLVAPNNVNRMAASYAINDFIQATNGALGVQDTSGTVPTLAMMALGGETGGTPESTALFGHIRRLQYYNTRLPNSELQRLTT